MGQRIDPKKLKTLLTIAIEPSHLSNSLKSMSRFFRNAQALILVSGKLTLKTDCLMTYNYRNKLKIFTQAAQNTYKDLGTKVYRF